LTPGMGGEGASIITYNFSGFFKAGFHIFKKKRGGDRWRKGSGRKKYWSKVTKIDTGVRV